MGRCRGMVTPGSAKALRVMLIDDSVPVRQRVRSLIEESCQAELVAEASSVAEALVFFHARRPDAVVLDLQLSDGDGCDVLSVIKRIHPDCVVIVLTTFSALEDRIRCFELGADFFFDKTMEFERVPEVLNRITASRPARDPMARVDP